MAGRIGTGQRRDGHVEHPIGHERRGGAFRNRAGFDACGEALAHEHTRLVTRIGRPRVDRAELQRRTGVVLLRYARRAGGWRRWRRVAGVAKRHLERDDRAGQCSTRIDYPHQHFIAVGQRHELELLICTRRPAAGVEGVDGIGQFGPHIGDARAVHGALGFIHVGPKQVGPHNPRLAGWAPCHDLLACQCWHVDRCHRDARHGRVERVFLADISQGAAASERHDHQALRYRVVAACRVESVLQDVR